jgi:nucleoside-diphosphate-sugar epimerase
LTSESKPTIFLTGATGFLGSHLMASFLKDGYRIIVAGRSNNEGSLKERIFKLLRWFGIDESGQLEFVEIDFLKPHLGLPEDEYIELCNKTGQIVHCASDTSFSEKKREVVLKSNVESLSGILEFASDSRAEFFHYISTAYVSGSKVPVCTESLSIATEFVNVYEESKALAENVIADFCNRNSIPFTIIRPSIVYGDSRSGRSLKFNALYFPIQSVNYIREIYLNDIINNNGRKSMKYGIYLDKEGCLFLPLRIFLPQRGILNIIPVDYFVEATMRIIKKAPPGGIFNLTNNSPARLDEISVYNEQFMKVRGVEIHYGNQKSDGCRNPAEELFDRFMEPYRFYLSDTRLFDRPNTDAITDNLHPPEFTYEIFRNCMAYAMSVNWGKTFS